MTHPWHIVFIGVFWQVACTGGSDTDTAGGGGADSTTVDTSMDDDTAGSGDSETAETGSPDSESGLPDTGDSSTDTGDTGSETSDSGGSETGSTDSGPDSETDVKLIGEDAGDYAGVSVAGLGDVDGDGRDDLAVAASMRESGVIYLIRGPVSAPFDFASADGQMTFESDEGSAWLSADEIPIGSAGDGDGDGLPDVLIGTPGMGADAAGAAYVVFGPWTGELSYADADASLIGVADDDFAGDAVAGVGDVDGDGWDDLLIGAPGANVGVSSTVGECGGSDDFDDWGYSVGVAYLMLGPTSGEHSLSEADARLTGEDGDDFAGKAASSVGDLDGDGLADLFVGSSNCEGGYEAGAAYVISGPVSGEFALSDADAKLVGDVGDRASEAMSSAGDVDGDGLPDLLVGAPYKDLSRTGLEGAAWLVLGPASGTEKLSDADARFEGYDLARAGTSLASAGDMDGDGFDDLVIGAPCESSGATDAGTAYLIYGPVTGTQKLADETHRLDGTGTYDFLGFSVANAGDTDGDGSTDLLVGAYRDDDGGTDAGAAWLLLGGGSLVSGGS